MRILASCLLLIAGVILISGGLSVSNSIGPGVFRLLSGSAADRTIWLLVGGMIAILTAAAGLLQEPAAKPAASLLP